MKDKIIKRDVKCYNCSGVGTASYKEPGDRVYWTRQCKKCEGNGILSIGCYKQLFKASGEDSSKCGQNYNTRVRFCSRCKRLDKKYKELELINTEIGCGKSYMNRFNHMEKCTRLYPCDNCQEKKDRINAKDGMEDRK